MDNIQMLRQLRLQAWDVRMQLWQEGFLTPRWWFIVAVIAIAYIVWWKLLDKRRFREIMLYGTFIAVTRVIFDNWGIMSGRWTYLIDIFPSGHSLFINDLTVVPLSLMLVYQYTRTWSQFLLWTTIVQALISFAYFPLLPRLGILEVYQWSYLNSFIFMLVTAVVQRAILLRILKVEHTYEDRYGHVGRPVFQTQPAMKPLFDKNPEGENDQ